MFDRHIAVYGLSDLAELWGVTRQTIYRRITTGYYPNFPDPLYEVRAGKLWSWEQINEFMQSYEKHKGQSDTVLVLKLLEDAKQKVFETQSP